MFERYTQTARKVVTLAEDEARTNNQGYVGTEHILVALMLVNEGIAARALRELDYDVNSFRSIIEVSAYQGHKPKNIAIPLTENAKATYENSLREALAFGSNYIETEHILLALLRDSGTLNRFGLKQQTIYNKVAELLRGKPMKGKSSQRKEDAKTAWQTLHKTEEENLNQIGLEESEVRSSRVLEITISGDLTLLVGRDIYGRSKVLIKNPSALPLTISEK